MRGALKDRLAEIAAHAHRENRKWDAGLTPKTIAELAKIGKIAAGDAGAPLSGRHGHQALKVDVTQGLSMLDQLTDARRRQTVLLEIARAVYFQQDGLSLTSPGRGLIDGRQDPIAIDAVEELAERNGAFGLVTLQVANQVPADKVRSEPFIGCFRPKLLRTSFAQVAQTCRNDIRGHIRVNVLGHAYDCNFGQIAPRVGRCAGDIFQHLLQIPPHGGLKRVHR